MLKSYVAISYIVLLLLVGFSLWIIRTLVKGLQRSSGYSNSEEFSSVSSQPDSQFHERPLGWTTWIVLGEGGGQKIQGVMTSVNPAGAFIESTARLKVGQELSLSIDVPDREQVRVTAQVLWVRDAMHNLVGAQVRFASLAPEKSAELFRLAGQRSLIVTGENSLQPRA